MPTGTRVALCNLWPTSICCSADVAAELIFCSSHRSPLSSLATCWAPGADGDVTHLPGGYPEPQAGGSGTRSFLAGMLDVVAPCTSVCIPIMPPSSLRWRAKPAFPIHG